MKIEDLICSYETAKQSRNEKISGDIYRQMIDLYIEQYHIDFELSEDELTDIIMDGISDIIGDFYLEKMVKLNFVEPLCTETGRFVFKVLPEGRSYLKKLEAIYGKGIVNHSG